MSAVSPIRVPRVLSIAGTDPSGGAGIQADLKSIAANGGYGMAVVTALVAQNTQGVRSVHVPPVTFLREQLDAVSDDVEIDAVKIGMLADAAIIEVVTEWLERVRPPVVVLDPVIVATSGDRLLDDAAEDALRALLPVAGLITPNLAELAVLAGAAEARDLAELVDQARELSASAGVRVLAKGGHLPGVVARDAVVDATAADPVRVLTAARIDTTSTHGTGCSLSSAVATWQPVVGDWFEAVDRSKRWLTESLRHGDSLQVGRGNGPVSHLAGLWARGGLETIHPVTEDWWLEISDVREATDMCAFVQGLADGSVAAADFTWYLAQDAVYLEAYAAVLARLGRLADDPGEQELWARGAEECIEEEAALHRDWLGGAEPVRPSATTEAYLAHLAASVERGYEVGVAAVLPCYWMYADIGTRLSHDVPDSHPYAAWLRTYGDPAFAEAAERAREVTDRVAAAADARTRAEMAQAFRRSAELELDFFRAPSER